MMNLRERIRQDGITCLAARCGVAADRPGVPAWSVELSRDARVYRDGRSVVEHRVFTLPDPFEMLGEPDAFEVLDLVVPACAVVDGVGSRAEWAAEYTADPEEGKRLFSQRDFETWLGINDRLRVFLGDGTHHLYLYETERGQ